MSEDLLVDGYDYNPHTCMVEVPYNDYWDMKDKCKENKQLQNELQQKENKIKEVRKKINDIRQSTFTKYNSNEWNNCLSFNDDIEPLLEILDKGE